MSIPAAARQAYFETLVEAYNQIPQLRSTIKLQSSELRHAFRDSLAFITEQCCNRPEAIKEFITVTDNASLDKTEAIIEKIKNEILFRAKMESKSDAHTESAYFIYQLLENSIRLLQKNNEEFLSQMDQVAFVNRVKRANHHEIIPPRLTSEMLPDWYKTRFPHWNQELQNPASPRKR